MLAPLTVASLHAVASPVAAQQNQIDPQGARTYADTPTDMYFSEPVAHHAERDLFDGTLCDSGFCPDAAIDRKTMAVWVVRMLDGQDPAPVTESRFDDVDPDSFYAPFIERMVDIKVTRGCGDGSGFCSDRTVTRAQMAVFLSRAFNLLESPDPDYSDVPVDAWYAIEVAKLTASGITKGCGDGTRFCPDRDTTRGQMATFLWRATRALPLPDPRSLGDSSCSFTASAPVVAASTFQVITDRGTGTAFFVGTNRFLTAAHVVSGVDTGEVTLRNETTDLVARVVGADFESDIAVLSASGAGIAPLSFGSVRRLGLGHALGVVGYPVYVTTSASLVTGVLSRAEDHDILGTLLQTDAAMNPGNSGGPLIDECGSVLGMAVAKLVDEAIEGISYAIASDTIVERLPAALDAGTGRVVTEAADVNVIMGRANWSTGYFQAELYKLLLEELGYTVSDPAENELGPNNGYIAMAQGEIDVWANSWYPTHLAWLAVGLPDGSLVEDHVTIVGEQMIAGGLQGFLITKSFADTYGVYTMDELNRNFAALAAFDAADLFPGNGKADIFGCPANWTCNNIISNQIAFNGWENIQQTKAGYDAMFAQAVDNVGEGVPTVIFTWTPSAYITKLRPGDNVYWMGMERILDDSNPANEEGGEQHDQRGADGSGGFAAISAEQCPAAAANADGLCPIGWISADILVTANKNFLEANPAARALFEAVRLSVIDVSLANVAQGAGESPADLAARWIADNRDRADEWLTAAAAAAATAETMEHRRDHGASR